MTTKEKIYVRKLLTRLYYQGDFEDVVDRLCSMVGWYPLELGGKLPESQQTEIGFYLKQGRA